MILHPQSHRVLSWTNLTDRRYRDAECKLAIVQAEGFARENKFKQAGLKFAEAMSHLVGPQLTVPLDPANGGGVKCPVYMNFTMDECLTAMTCCNGAAMNLFESDELVKVSTHRNVSLLFSDPPVHTGPRLELGG